MFDALIAGSALLLFPDLLHPPAPNARIIPAAAIKEYVSKGFMMSNLFVSDEFNS
jgi:hypothetical protein